MKLETGETDFKDCGLEANQKNEARSKARRQRVSQAEVPSLSLEEALRIPQAIFDDYNLKPTKPLLVAQATGMTPTSGPFRMLCGAAIAYGLTDAGYNSDLISVTELGKRIVSPTTAGDDEVALREAFLRPRLIALFLKRYDGGKFPKDRIGENVLMELGIPRDSAPRVFKLIAEGAQKYGLLKILKGGPFVDLSVSQKSTEQLQQGSGDHYTDPQNEERMVAPATGSQGIANFSNKLKMFITHGKNVSLIPKVRQILAYGGFEGIVAIERATVAKPLSKKVYDDMSACSASIILVTREGDQAEGDGQSGYINGNVLIEIGMGLMLFGSRLILLVEEGIDVPSNLSGLYQVRFNGPGLDAETALKLLEACNELRNSP